MFAPKSTRAWKCSLLSKEDEDMLRASFRQPRWWLALLQALVLVATLALPAVAAAQTPVPQSELIPLLQHYRIVRGDELGNLNLEKPITRAEMMTILVRTLGAEMEAEFFRSFNPFEDAKGHWAEANIAYAALKQYVKGDGDGKVRPNDSISWAESMTLVLRIVGREPTTGEWPFNVLLAAGQHGIVPLGVNAGNVREPAIRGLIFQSMAKAVTTLTNEAGQTFLQAYVDSTPPALTVTKPVATTNNATVTISGTVSGAKSLKVNGKTVNWTGTAFSTSVSLEYGVNSIKVEAADHAGNTTVEEVAVTRIHPITAFEISGPDKVRPGGTATYVIVARNSSGQTLPLTGVDVKVEGNIGTFNLSTLTLTAANTPAKGKITLTAGTVVKSINVEVMGKSADAARLNLRPVNGGLAVPFTKPMTVSVEIQDALGQFVSEDYGRAVTLRAAGLTGLAVSPQVAYTEGGVATFTVTTTVMGFVALEALSDGLTSDVRAAEFGSNLRVQLQADPNTIMVGGSSTFSRIRGVLVNENGVPTVNNTNADIIVQLSTTGAQGTLIQSLVRIPMNQSTSATSGVEGTFTAGAFAGITRVTGSISSGQNLTVDPVNITLTVPTIGAGSFWDLIGNNSHPKNTQASFLLRLSDQAGNTIPGQYAFQVSVSTSNNEAKTDGIPAGVEIWIGDTAVTNTNTVLRTVSGAATLKVRYNKPGQVQLTIVTVGSHTAALGPDGLLGPATSAGVPNRTFTLNYSGTVNGAKLVVDTEALGNDRSVGASATGSGKTFTLRAQATESGNWVPGVTGTVQLFRSSGTATLPPSVMVGTISNGTATFTVSPGTGAGQDEYYVQVTVGGITYTSSVVTLYVQNTAPATPSILAIRGTNNGIPGALDYVSPSDTGMEVELAQNPAQKWVVVRVYRENQSTPIYTSDPIDISTVAPRVTVPKSALPSGVSRYQVTVRNGHSESAKSGTSNQVTNSVYVTNIGLANGRYQWTTKHLTITGSNYNSNDTINPALIQISNGATQRSLAGAQIVLISSNQIVLNLTTATHLADIENPLLFRGSDVKLTADASWYTRSNGEQSAAITTGAYVTPMAHISHLEYDHINSRLYLVGAGFNRVALDFSKLLLQAAGQADVSLGGLSNTRLSDTRWQINLSSTVTTALNTHGTYVLNAGAGWAYDSSWTQLAISTVPIYGTVALSSVTYNGTDGTVTITGSGFSGGSVTVGSLTAHNLTNSYSAALAGTYVINGDSSIVITLSPDILANASNYFGSEVYLEGSIGWFTNASGRSSSAIPARALRFPTFPTP